MESSRTIMQLFDAYLDEYKRNLPPEYVRREPTPEEAAELEDYWLRPFVSWREVVRLTAYHLTYTTLFKGRPIDGMAFGASVQYLTSADYKEREAEYRRLAKIRTLTPEETRDVMRGFSLPWDPCRSPE